VVVPKFSRHLLSVTLACGGFLLPAWASAQTGGVVEGTHGILAIVQGPMEVRVGKTIVLDASPSVAESSTVRYQWFLNDRLISTAAEAILTFERTGEREVRLILTDRFEGQERRADVRLTVSVYERKVAMLVSLEVPPEKIDVHRKAAMEGGVFLAVLQQDTAASPLGEEEQWLEIIRTRADRLIGADAFVIWSEGVAALNALSRAVKTDETLLHALRDHTVVILSEGALGPLRRIAGAPFAVLNPQRIVLTRREAIPPLLTSSNAEAFLEEILRRDMEHVIVDRSTLAVRPWNVLSTLVNSMITRGVPTQTIVLLLMLPVIVTIIAFLRQVVGVTTLGLYTPSVIALSLVALGWKIGVVLLALIILSGYLAQLVMDRFRLLHIPRIAIILTVISVAVLLVVALGAMFDVRLQPEMIFVVLILSTLAERFVSIKVEEGWTAAFTSVSEVVAVSMICFFVVQWELMRSFLLAYPEAVLLLIIADVALGKFTGLRVREYVRFRWVLEHLKEEE
jgi:hypothetical protein